MMNATRTPYGFEWNGHKVECECYDDKKGWVLVRISTKKASLAVRITKTGKIIIHSGTKEWKEVSKGK